MAEIHSEQQEEIRQMTQVGDYCEKLRIQPLPPPHHSDRYGEGATS